ncbi:MAG: hypothetical protein QF721_04750 [Verrucomicrobiota bacterium]|nr:hypothetical protein [Verrucomicrobiota bacterium]
MNRSMTQQGAALVITLIMLGMVTAMTVVFLGISQRERASVTVVSDQVSAKLMAETAAASALSEVVGRMVAAQDPLVYDFSVSTNYLNRFGFVPGRVSPTNVSYFYPNGRALTPDDLLINLANLHELARPPVFVDTNALGWRPKNYKAVEDFRFYLDLNRNRAFEPTGLQVVTNRFGDPVVGPHYLAPPWPGDQRPENQLATDYFVGDPEWIGQLENPAFAHGPTNRFIGRYAYMILPTGRSLDINHIHNQAREPMNPRLDTPAGARNQFLFLRNQGVGSWELNLAGFLRQLNPIQWRYYYYWRSLPINAKGLDFPVVNDSAFSDARDIMMHRYYGSRRNLSGILPALGLLPNDPRFGLNMIDDYSDGPLVLNSTPTLDSEDGLRVDPANAPWPGAENPRRFTDVQQLLTFQPYDEQTPRANNFVTRLRQAMNVRPKSMKTLPRLGSYERYTYYRLLSQMGVDSEPALRGKLNINYANDWFTGRNTQTNWTADEFINRAAHAMLRASLTTRSVTNPVTGNIHTAGFIGGMVVNPDIGITGLRHPLFPARLNQTVFNPTNAVSSGIQLFPANAYTPEVHRLLQLAANIHDATTNRLVYPHPPTVMRPVFRKYANPGSGTGVFISRYTEVTNDWQRIRRQGFFDLTNVVLRPQFKFDTDLHINIHGVPWIVGAKKGLPNFNEYSVESIVQVSRRLEVNKGNAANIAPAMSRNWRTNQMYTLGITNVFGIEGWNSYTNAYPRRLGMDVRHQYQIGLWDHSITNRSGIALPRLLTNLVSTPYNRFTTLQPYEWRGGEFRVPLNAGATTITNSIYSTGLKRFFPANRASTNVFETGFAVPDWKLHITNRVQYFLVDLDLNRVVDAVNLDNMVTSMDITQLTSGQTTVSSSLFGSGSLSEGAFWDTNRVDTSRGARSPTFGIVNQIKVSSGEKPVSTAYWRSYNNDPYAGRNKDKAIQDFNDFLQGRNRPRRPSDLIRKQAPFTPTRKIYKRAAWQANDPLVHYTVNDLTDPIITDRFSTNNVVYLRPPNTPLPASNIGLINERYRPWGGGGPSPDVNAFNYYTKDPLITGSDAWQFPENKFPSIGWLGRVHRGTSWQTMYLKSGVSSLTNWWAWSGSFGVHNLMKGFDRDRDGMPDYWETLYGLNPQKPDAYYDADVDGLVNLQEYRAGTHPLLSSPLLGLSTTHPTNDWRLLQLFTTAPNADAASGLLSVNQTNAAAWAAVFSGVTVLSNSLPDSPTLGAFVAEVGTAEEPHLIQPTLPSTGSPQLDWILHGTHGLPTMWINGQANIIPGLDQMRQAKGGFRTLGDILSTPTLTEFSPFLNLGETTWVPNVDRPGRLPGPLRPQPMSLTLPGSLPSEQQKYGIHENVMEWIPQQILSLLKEDEPRVTVYAFGQALKPAENSIVTRPGRYYGMCTNYAIVGEVFTKTTYKLEEQWEGTNQVFRTVVEDYQVLAEE